MLRPRWLFFLIAGIFGLGVAGFTGSSWWHGARFSLLYDRETRLGLHEVVGLSRGIRSDEWGIETPAQRSGQLQDFPRADSLATLGRLARSTAQVPVLDWGLSFRPLLWPLLWKSPQAFALRWSLRSAVALLAAFLFLRAMTLRDGSPPEEQRARRTVAALGAVAVAYSSAWQWWLSGGFVEIVALGLLAAAAGSWWLSSRKKRAAIAFAALAPCAFFHFYPPLWGPLLLVLCAALADQARRSGRVVRAVPLFVGLGAGAALSIAYFSAYLASVMKTVYPGRRIAEAGLLPPGRLLDLLWPSLTATAPFAGFEHYLGPERSNVCEGSAVEALPLFLLAICAFSPRLREAARRAVGRSPFSFGVWLLFAAWLILPLPSFVTRLAFLQYTPWFRLWFVFGLSSALFATQLLGELCAADLPPARHELAAAALFLGWAFLMAYLRAPDLDLEPLEDLGHQAPLLLALGLSLLAVRRLDRRQGPMLLGVAWALPLVLANVSVNPVVRASDLFQRGRGHQVIDRALESRPGRLLDYSTQIADTLLGYGWPVLAAAQVAPDRGFFRFLSPDSPGLDPAIYDRYSRLSFVRPPAPTALTGLDLLQVSISPCSPRLAALYVNHLLTGPRARLPDTCADQFDHSPAGDLVLWSRKRPVCLTGTAARFSDDALDYDYSCRAEAPAIERDRAGLLLHFREKGFFALSISPALFGPLACDGVVARQGEAHLFFETRGNGGSCRLPFAGTLDGLRALKGQSR